MTAAAAPSNSLRADATVIGLVGIAHSISHYSQLLLPPLFPWLKDAFGVSYTELGLLLTIFYVVSCIVQAASGFVVDRIGPRPVLFVGLALLAVAAFGYAISSNWWMLAFFSAVAGTGNGVFHPVDFTLLNRKIRQSRLGHAFSVHGITGSLGWALAPAMMVPLTLAFSWRVALASAGLLALAVLALLWFNRKHLTLELAASPSHRGVSAADDRGLAFLRIPAVWVCFGFFLFYAAALSGVQSFAPQAARELHAVPAELAAACLSIYMVVSAVGMVFGGFLAADPNRIERIVAVGFGAGSLVALAVGYLTMPAIAVPVMFAVMGFALGLAGPSRDLLVKRSTPDNATGRVYGIVYGGIDIGSALAPLVFGALMDGGRFSTVWLGIALVQAVLILAAFNVKKVRRTSLVPA